MNGIHAPLLSVVIPTYKRPQYLPRAIASALQAAPDGDVEVIVVPNGPDESWKSLASRYSADARVRWHPIIVAHANVARNHGLRTARGKFIRFLDDDDFFLPAASEQLEALEVSGAEVSSGLIQNIDEDGVQHDLLSFPSTDDFACAAVSFSGFALPTTHTFLRSCLENSNWDIALRRRQDYGWLLDLVSNREWEWVHLDKPVGAWFQHRGTRISHAKFMKEREQPVVDKLLALYEKLDDEKRLNAARCAAIANALWHHAHLGFPYHPRYWTGIARRAQSICSDARPPNSFFETGLMRAIDPVVGEWMLLPIRRSVKIAKGFVITKRGVDHKRNL
jgi:glycosyltransferase involved in cell wall biosynthesis